MNALYAEWTKLRTLPGTIWLLAGAVLTTVAVSTLTAGAFNASDAWVSHLFVGDTVISSPVTQRDAVASAVRDSPDISAATPLRFFSEPVAGAVLGITAL